MKDKKTIKSLEHLASDLLRNHAAHQTILADLLEALIIQASVRFNDVMCEIGNDNVQANKDQLCEAIQATEDRCLARDPHCR